eukprot:m.125331 g.125331  ORF g.125331 m.125331 type:complete len:279 (-) comp14669_c0_seq9:368-1204(-)
MLKELPEHKRQCLKFLSFTRNRIGDRDLLTLYNIFQLFPNLEEVDLSFTDLRNPNHKGMLTLLRSISKLTTFSFHSTVFATATTSRQFYEMLTTEDIQKLIFVSYSFLTDPTSDPSCLPRRHCTAMWESHKESLLSTERRLLKNTNVANWMERSGDASSDFSNPTPAMNFWWEQLQQQRARVGLEEMDGAGATTDTTAGAAAAIDPQAARDTPPSLCDGSDHGESQSDWAMSVGLAPGRSGESVTFPLENFDAFVSQVGEYFAQPILEAGSIAGIFWK